MRCLLVLKNFRYYLVPAATDKVPLIIVYFPDASIEMLGEPGPFPAALDFHVRLERADVPRVSNTSEPHDVAVVQDAVTLPAPGNGASVISASPAAVEQAV